MGRQTRERNVMHRRAAQTTAETNTAKSNETERVNRSLRDEAAEEEEEDSVERHLDELRHE